MLRPLIRPLGGLPDRLGGPAEERLGNGEAEDLGRLHVDDQLEFRRVLRRQVDGLGPLEAAGVSRLTSKRCWPVATKAAREEVTHLSISQGTVMGSGERTHRFIALFKLLQGVLLLGVSLGAMLLVRRDVADLVAAWVTELDLDPENRAVTWLSSTSGRPSRIRSRRSASGCSAMRLCC